MEIGGLLVKMGRTTFLRTNEMFCEKGCHSENKTNNEQTKWIVQRNEKRSFLKTFNKTNILKLF